MKGTIEGKFLVPERIELLTFLLAEKLHHVQFYAARCWSQFCSRRRDRGWWGVCSARLGTAVVPGTRPSLLHNTVENWIRFCTVFNPGNLKLRL